MNVGINLSKNVGTATVGFWSETLVFTCEKDSD